MSKWSLLILPLTGLFFLFQNCDRRVESDSPLPTQIEPLGNELATIQEAKLLSLQIGNSQNITVDFQTHNIQIASSPPLGTLPLEYLPEEECKNEKLIEDLEGVLNGASLCLNGIDERKTQVVIACDNMYIMGYGQLTYFDGTETSTVYLGRDVFSHDYPNYNLGCHPHVDLCLPQKEQLQEIIKDIKNEEYVFACI